MASYGLHDDRTERDYDDDARPGRGGALRSDRFRAKPYARPASRVPDFGGSRRSFLDRDGDRGESDYSAPRRGGGSSEGNWLYVHNLTWKTSWQDLKDHFRQCGEVVHAKIFSEQSTGRSRGCGIVEFETKREAAKAVDELNESELDGRNILVREDREDGKGGGKGGGRRSGRDDSFESRSSGGPIRRGGKGKGGKGRGKGSRDDPSKSSEQLDDDLDSYFAARSSGKATAKDEEMEEGEE